jgi:hypothetical protein
MIACKMKNWTLEGNPQASWKTDSLSKSWDWANDSKEGRKARDQALASPGLLKVFKEANDEVYPTNF